MVGQQTLNLLMILWVRYPPRDPIHIAGIAQAGRAIAL